MKDAGAGVIGFGDMAVRGDTVNMKLVASVGAVVSKPEKTEPLRERFEALGACRNGATDKGVPAALGTAKLRGVPAKLRGVPAKVRGVPGMLAFPKGAGEVNGASLSDAGVCSA
jgi:hypothetical protein